MKLNKFVEIILSDNKKCVIYEPNSYCFFKAQTKFLISDKKEIGFIPFLFQIIIEIDKKHLTIDEICNLNIEDYISITEATNLLFDKLKI